MMYSPVQTYAVMRIETCPVKRTNNLSPFCEWIIFIGAKPERGLAMPKSMIFIVDSSFSEQSKFSGLISRCTMPWEWICCNPESCRRVSARREIQMCRTHYLIHDPNNSLHHHTSVTLLLLVCNARSQKLHSHVFEMIELTVSIHNGNEGSSLKYLQYSSCWRMGRFTLFETRDFLITTSLSEPRSEAL
jgi:hypothetical protein